MASLKYVIRKSKQLKNGQYTIYLQLVHNRKTRYIPTMYKISADQFDNGTVVHHPNSRHINISLRTTLNDCEKKLISIEDQLPYQDISMILNYLKNTEQSGKLNFYAVANLEIEKDKKRGGALWRTMSDTMAILSKYQTELYFNDITVKWLENFECFLRQRGNKNSSISFHIRNIRNMFNRAIKYHSLSRNLYPFEIYRIPKPESKPIEYIPIKEFVQYLNYKPMNKGQEKAKDLFLLSFYLIGANFKDILTAKPEQIKDDRFYYIRSKTKKEYSIHLIPEAVAVLNKYPGKKYLLNFIERYKQDDILNGKAVKGIIKNTNERNKNISKKLSIMRFSTYSARYSWATIAHMVGVPRDIISLALGHADGVKVTSLYINYDLSEIDDANNKVINFIKNKLT